MGRVKWGTRRYCWRGWRRTHCYSYRVPLSYSPPELLSAHMGDVGAGRNTHTAVTHGKTQQWLQEKLGGNLDGFKRVGQGFCEHTGSNVLGHGSDGTPSRHQGWFGVSQSRCKDLCKQHKCKYMSYSDRDFYAPDRRHCMLFRSCERGRASYLSHLWSTYQVG